MSGAILVIDDDALNRKLVRRLLTDAGLRVQEAADAESGLSMAREQPPQCVIMDIRLPGMDGLAATRILKADEGLRHVPVVALTGMGADEEERALEAGCDGFLTKPFDTRALVEQVERFMRRSRLSDEAGSGLPQGRRARILIADDEPACLDVFDRLLEGAGYGRILASGGLEALREAVAQKPDLVLLDVLMPDLDGIEVVRRLKRNLQTAHIPTILVTALAGPEDRARGLRAGADEFISKPVDSAELLVRIKAVLHLSHLQEQLSLRTRIAEHTGGEASWGRAGGDRPERRVLLAAADPGPTIESSLAGHQIMRTATAAELLTLTGKGGIDLIVLSSSFADADGFHLCRQIKDRRDGGHVPVALLGTRDDPVAKIQSIDAGADDFLARSMGVGELSARIGNLFRRHDQLADLQARYRKAVDAATSDGLTGLHNKAYFKRFLDLEVKRSLRHGCPVALLLLDIDDFKAKNDSLGHLAGDMILSDVGRLLIGGIREIDLAARYGGEEFAVVLPYGESAGAQVVTERLRSSIESHGFLADAGPSPSVRVTVSVGVAFCPVDATSSDDLVRKADQMLYQAKREGKNRVCMSQPTARPKP